MRVLCHECDGTFSTVHMFRRHGCHKEAYLRERSIQRYSIQQHSENPKNVVQVWPDNLILNLKIFLQFKKRWE